MAFEASDGTRLRLRLIGQMDATSTAGAGVLPAGRKTRALLAYLALTAPRPTLRGKLAELLWSRRPEEQARASLRQEIHRLLEALAPVGDVLNVARDQLSLNAPRVWTDAQEILRATPAQPASLSLLNGELLEDLDGLDSNFDAWLTIERERLRDRARLLAEQLLEEKREPESAIPAAQRLLAIDRSHEGAWRALMRAHAARGERGMAIQAYERCRAVLADLLDTAPSLETQKLLAEIRGNGSRLPNRRGAMPAALIELTAPIQLPSAAIEAAREPRPMVNGVRIGILPLQTVGAGAGESHLAIGLAAEVTTALARVHGLNVVSSDSLARLTESSRDEIAMREAFSLDYLLDGNVQHAGSRVRVTVCLLDLRAGNQVAWAGRFDRHGDDPLGLQDGIASEIVARIDPEILLLEARKASARPSSGQTAYELVMRSLPLTNRMERDTFLLAGEHLAEALRIAPDYAPAHTWYAWWHLILVGQGWETDLASAVQRAGDLAARAVRLDGQDARALTIAGHVLAYLQRRPADALILHERALSQNPNLTAAWAFSSGAYLYLGEIDQAQRRYDRYKQLSPIDPYAFFYDSLSVLIPLLRRDHRAAIEAGRRLSPMNQWFAPGLVPYLSALGHLGLHGEAGTIRRHLLKLNPAYTVGTFLGRAAYARDADRAHIAEGLALAGLPDG